VKKGLRPTYDQIVSRNLEIRYLLDKMAGNLNWLLLSGKSSGRAGIHVGRDLDDSGWV
jgi:hypothetical protein